MNGEFCVAVHALVFLIHKASNQSSETLAENICTHPARVRKVMAKLKKAGLVETREGSEGGYRFVLDPASVSLRQIAEALDTHFVTTAWHSGASDMDCLIASGMADVMDEICGQLNELCGERLSGITIRDIDRKIFGGACHEISD